MESITKTTMTPVTRVRSASPQASLIRLAATRGWAQGTTVFAFGSDARGVFDVKVRPTFYVGSFGATAPKTIAHNSMDVVYLRSGEPPV